MAHPCTDKSARPSRLITQTKGHFPLICSSAILTWYSKFPFSFCFPLKVPEIGIPQGNDVVQIANARLECLCELLFNQSFRYILSVLQTVEKLPMSLDPIGMTDAYIANPSLGTYVVALQLPSNRCTVKPSCTSKHFVIDKITKNYILLLVCGEP